MFDHTHYVPILRWKAGEMWALAKMAPEQSARLTPLIELVPETFAQTKVKKKLSPDEVVRRVVEQIYEHWGHDSIFVDLCHIDEQLYRASQGTHLVLALARDAALYQLAIVPVIGFDCSRDYQLAIKQICTNSRRGACLRLTHEDFEKRNLANQLLHLVDSLNLNLHEVDLLVDNQYIGNSIPNIAQCCGALPSLDRWRTFTWAAGAFSIKPSTSSKANWHH